MNEREEMQKKQIKDELDSKDFSSGELLAILGLIEVIKDKESAVRQYSVDRLINDSKTIALLDALPFG